VTLDGSSVRFSVRSAGRYAFVHTAALTAFAAGTVTGVDGGPFIGGLVSTPTLPIVSLSRGVDRCVAAAAIGDAVFRHRPGSRRFGTDR
jgi:hypothetical protein